MVKSQCGFSMVELMSVLAIFGVLVSLALAQFTRYQARALQTEAKIFLSNSYTGLKAHRAEFGYYTACLQRVGAFPKGQMGGFHDGWYAYGFTSWSALMASCGTEGVTSCLLFGEIEANTMCQVRETVALPLQHMGLEITDIFFDIAAMTALASHSYLLEAAGHVNGNLLTLDRWSINEGKRLYWVNSGI